MKNLILLVSILVSACGNSAEITSPTPTPTTTTTHKAIPVHISVPQASLDFPLEKRPEGTTAEHGVPYVDGPAFWQQNGPAIDISSHCTQEPGKSFRRMLLGHILTVTFDDGTTKDLTIVEIDVVTYESAADPMHHDFIDQDGNRYTPQTWAEYVMDREGAYVLHTSRCTGDGSLSFGQTFYIAQ